MEKSKLITLLGLVIVITLGWFLWNAKVPKSNPPQIQSIKETQRYLQTTKENADWKVYENKEVGISFNYPTNLVEVKEEVSSSTTNLDIIGKSLAIILLDKTKE